MAKRIVAPVWRPRSQVLTRRGVVSGIGALTVLGPLRGIAQSAANCAATPDSGEGPFYFDPDLLRSDIVDGNIGAPLGLELEVISADGCQVLTDARVDIWQADAVGLYSGYSNQPGVGGGIDTDRRGRVELRGTQVTDGDGRVSFQTIYPSWYGGRTPHIHFKVFVSEREVIAGQIFLPDDVSEEVFSTIQPYRQHYRRRTAFNSNDMFLVDGALQGAMSTIVRDGETYRASATLSVETT